MNNKNIVILMTSLGFGGAERVAVSYANWLANNTNNNIYILKFDHSSSAYDLEKKIKILEMENISSNRIMAIIQRYNFCRKNLKKIGADIVFAMFYQTELYAYYSKPHSCKLIGSERCNIDVLNYKKRIITKFASKKCNGFIFQTNGIKKLFPNKVVKISTVIPNAISNDKVYKNYNHNREEIITAMGRLTYQKGFDILIKAFKLVNKKHNNYRLEIYGEGEDRIKLQKLIDDLDLAKKVNLVGNTKNAIEKIACSQIFVLSSRYEGMPNALIEAMATGTACVSTNCNFGPSDLIVDKKNGLLTEMDSVEDLANNINFLIENEKSRVDIQNEAIKIRKELDRNNIYAKYYNYFVDISSKKTFASKIIECFFRPSIIIKAFLNRGYFNWLSDKAFLKFIYKYKFKKKLDLKNPRTFNEKLQWLKINNHNPLYTSLVDKYLVRDYVEKKIGEKYLIPIIGVYDNFDGIDIDKLPNKFVIKCNHDSGGIVIVKDKSKINIEQVRKKINSSLERNYYYNGREWPYKNVVPKIIIEEYMEDKNSKELIDYKVMCFNGEPKMIFTCTDRYSDGLKVTFFDLNWNKLPFERHYPSSKKIIKKPKNFNKMIELSKLLSNNFPFVRIDWYEINGRLYFGEYTFYPGSGFEEFNPSEWDYKLGEMINLQNKEMK